MNWHIVFIGISLILECVFMVVYVWNMRFGTTRPNRMAWFLSTTVSLINFFASYAAWAQNTLWLFALMPICNTTVFLFALRYGSGGFRRLDIFCLIWALVGVCIWQLLQNPLYGLVTYCITHFISQFPTLVHAWKQPEEENALAWMFGMLIGLANIMVVDSWTNINIWLTPTYLTGMITLIFLFTLRPHLARFWTYKFS